MIDTIVFVVASAMVIGGALGVVLLRHPVHAALSLVLTLFGVAVHFVSMEAQFLAAVQVIVYAGAIVVLFLFVIMLLGVDRVPTLSVDPLPIQRPLAAVSCAGIVALVVAAIVAAGDQVGLAVGDGIAVAGEAPRGGTATVGSGAAGGHDANIRQLADSLFSNYVLAFELTSVLLIVAVAGTVLMTRKARRTDADEPTSGVAA